MGKSNLFGVCVIRAILERVREGLFKWICNLFFSEKYFAPAKTGASNPPAFFNPSTFLARASGGVSYGHVKKQAGLDPERSTGSMFQMCTYGMPRRMCTGSTKTCTESNTSASAPASTNLSGQ